ncbi:hypothetical protein E1B28_001453 [Marasmius oreades]|uniref:Methyltransferase domain-containing protein n=1 Tax=Marasmius oreades TaxID=181124 RepID=A0A9P7V3E9_9AGAR|nr:uncharacterized protein E1B28_001453 [Marasmius oreades]KAG7099625.1 hypothetical protein E1B28_001453 [Marasmius oreades]
MTSSSPPTPNVSVSPPRTGTFTSTNPKSYSFDQGRRTTRPKESQFIYKHGQRLHSFDPEKAPYPLSYDRYVLELESLDNRFVKHLRKGSMSFLNLSTAEKPSRCLDLGCGTGTWIIDAAKEWPDCEFVGFDLVNIQIPLSMTNSSISNRIQWVHGNFLTTKLPFEDDEFDHVHVQSIASGVPENKWDVLFDEINRVLRPGGSIEFIEDDVFFPSLPRWFTTSLRVRPRRATSVHLPDGSLRGSVPYPDISVECPSHDHALLESLYTSVFEHRFINTKPSALLPSYFATYFRHITLGPIISFSMPPLTPLQPLPPQLATAYAIELSTSDSPDQRSSLTLSSPSVIGKGRPNLSFSSTLSAALVTPSEISTKGKYPTSILCPDNKDTMTFCEVDQLRPTQGQPASTRPKLYSLDSSLIEKTVHALPPDLIQHEQLDKMSERSLAMHLYRSYSLVLACQEAIWEELKDRLRNRKDELKPYGWDDDEELEELHNRKKFERLIERYQKDMKHRISLWSSLSDMDWLLPTREPLSKAELIEEERLREAMLEARRWASPEDLQRPCRSFRVLIGFKPCDSPTQPLTLVHTHDSTRARMDHDIA